MFDPVQSWGISLAYLGVVAAVAALTTLAMRLAWWRELARVRAVLLASLGLPADLAPEHASAWARARIEALIPCRQRKGPRRCWLCIARDRVVLVRRGEALAVAFGGDGRIALSGAGTRGRCAFAVEGESGPIVLEVARVEDMVRVVNLAVKHHVAIGYLRS